MENRKRSIIQYYNDEIDNVLFDEEEETICLFYCTGLNVFKKKREQIAILTDVTDDFIGNTFNAQRRTFKWSRENHDLYFQGLPTMSVV